MSIKGSRILLRRRGPVKPQKEKRLAVDTDAASPAVNALIDRESIDEKHGPSGKSSSFFG
jgi:hypothetical protein